jgi:hypothetical protein
MGRSRCGFYRRGFMKDQRLVRGPVCVFASLNQYEEKIRNTAWRNPQIILEFCNNRNTVTKRKIKFIIVIILNED